MSKEERSKNIMDLFEQIYDLDDEARASKLAEIAATDPTLKEDLLALLESKNKADDQGFLNVSSQSSFQQNSPAIGRQIGAFEIEEVLAAGGMGTVYKARHIHLDRPIALKVPHLLHPNRDHLFERLQREGKALAKLDHPNIVKVYDAGITEDEVPFIAMAFLHGDSLATVNDKGPISIENVIKWGIQLAEALDYLHRQQIFHRDIKTSNILLDESNNAILADFGIAYVGDLSRMTGQLPGTPAYMCPEQLRGRAIDGRCDIYSLGLVLYELLAGQPSDGRSLKAHRKDVPDKLAQVIGKCIENNPAYRYQTGAALAKALAFKEPEKRPVKKITSGTVLTIFLVMWMLFVVIAAGRNFFNPSEETPSAETLSAETLSEETVSVETASPAIETPSPSLIDTIIDRGDNLTSLRLHLENQAWSEALASGNAEDFVDPDNCFIFVFNNEASSPIAILEPGSETRKDRLTGNVVNDPDAFLVDKRSLWVLVY